ncbi:MAG: hypothetical protein E7461_01210 [Ruminococcaceae bacterium]|nr:hypothetical protein [Oscillospiraceae bacterium]
MSLLTVTNARRGGSVGVGSVGASVGISVGISVGASVGASVGTSVGASVGSIICGGSVGEGTPSSGKKISSSESAMITTIPITGI